MAVWHKCFTKAKNDANIWETLPLARSAIEPFALLGFSPSTVHRYIFTAALTIDPESNGGSLGNFTIKFRSRPSVPWQWVKDQFGTSDGSLLLPCAKEDGPISAWASSIFGDHYLQQWNMTALQSQAPGATLYKVESEDFIPRNNVDDAKYETKNFGSSNTGFCRYMALIRIWAPWLAPRHGSEWFRITEDALLCSFLTNEGQHAVLLPMNGVNDTLTVFRSDDQGHIIVAARNDGIAEGKFEFLAAVADSFEVANAAVMYEAREIIVRNRSANEEATPPLGQTKTETFVSKDSIVVDKNSLNSQSEPNPQSLEEWYDGLTYCTWNSLGQDLNAEKISSALEDLASNNIHVSGLIIDDNWQSVDGKQGQTSQFQRCWTDFEANKEGFPDGLKSTITRIKSQHPAISNVAVWHGLHGYWGGISPSGTIASTYKICEVEKRPGIIGGKMLAIDPADIHRMYDDFYAFLSSCGVTSVKTDVQFYLDVLNSTPDRRALTTAYQSAWTSAHLRHFAGKAISCMSQIPQILFQSFLPVNSPRVLLRNSDDFFPLIPVSHPWHVFCNAHNALFVQHLNVLPDWDMFQTSHPYSSFHAAARCVSGGPIYITDTPGEHDLGLIAQITAENVRGQTVILRPSMVGKTIGIYDKYHEGQILRIGTYNGSAQTGNGILGLFNISDHEISAMVPITDFPGINGVRTVVPDANKNPTSPAPSERFIIRSHLSSQISNPIIPSASNPSSNLISLTLPIRGYDILTAHPVHEFSISQSKQASASEEPKTPIKTSIAILGLLGKMTGACAITLTHLETVGTTKLRVHVQLKALGTLGLWISDLDSRSIDDDFLVTILGQVVPRDRVKKRSLISATESASGDGDAEGDVEGSEKQAAILEIDVLGAWKEMKLHSGWSNEVGVEVFVH